jgi:hypothetical protein
MTTLENLRTRKLQLEKHLKESLSAEQREWIEGEISKVDIALGFLDELPNDISRRAPRSK